MTHTIHSAKQGLTGIHTLGRHHTEPKEPNAVQTWWTFFFFLVQSFVLFFALKPRPFLLQKLLFVYNFKQKA